MTLTECRKCDYCGAPLHPTNMTGLCLVCSPRLVDVGEGMQMTVTGGVSALRDQLALDNAYILDLEGELRLLRKHG